MSALSIEVPFPVFQDRDGQPLDNGYIWLGVANLNPQTNPVVAYFDAALTIVAPQPLRTINGYVSRAGTPAQIYVDAVSFSILVQDSKGTMVYNFPDGTGISPDACGVTYNPPFTSAVPYPVCEKLNSAPSIVDFGAVPDGLTPANTAIGLMASECGFIVVPYGDFAVTTITIDIPIYFQDGGAITVPTANTVRFRTRISASPKQQIFKGDGNIRFEIDNALGIGEDSKHSYAAWWGIFPVGQTNNIQTALFNKALAAYTSQAREGIFELDIGSYRIDGKITIPRGVHLKGAGSRRTIFDLVNDGYTAIESGGSAVKITGIQFEQPSIGSSYFDGIQIGMLHDSPALEDIRLWNCRVGVYLNQATTQAYLNRIYGVFNTEPVGGYPANSALVWAQGNSMLIEDVQVTNTGFGPESVVLLGYQSPTSISSCIINDVQSTEKTIPVKIVADTANINNTIVNNVVFSGSLGLNIDAVVEAQTSGSAVISGLSMSNISSNSVGAALFKITQGSTGITQAITLASGSAQSPNTKAAELIRTAGTLTGVVIGQAVAASLAPQPVVTTGIMSKITVPDHLWPILTIADDSVAQVTPLVIGGLITIINMGSNGNFPQVTSSGQVLYDVGSTPTALKIAGGANLVTLAGNTVPTGTTGSIGNLSVSAVDTGIFYFENRTGGSIEVRFSFK
jgi:hypothetical protein